MLVVIAIIAILAAALLSALSTAKQKAQAIKCVSQPIINCIAADTHALKWKVLFRQNHAANRYDPNWLSFGTGGQINTDAPTPAATRTPVTTI